MTKMHYGTSSAEDKISPQCSQNDVAQKKVAATIWEDLAEGSGRKVYLFCQHYCLSHFCCCYTLATLTAGVNFLDGVA